MKRLDRSSRSFVCLLVGVVSVLSVAAILALAFSRTVSSLRGPQPPSSLAAVRKAFAGSINSTRMREDLWELTSHPHIAGTERDRETALWVKQRFLDLGFETWIEEFEVLLSYPVHSSLEILSGAAPGFSELEQSEREVEGDRTSSEFVPIFNGYSGSGSAVGPLAYINYCRRQDFDQVQVPSGSVCICRYGKIYRGDKAREAESHGCLGLLIVSDPADTLAEKEEEAVREGRATPMDVDRYPLSASLPLDGVQRGSVLIPNGDPLTPGWPATSHEQRLPRDAEYVKESLPSIPVRPISASNVLPLMKVMDGPDAPEDWQGGLPITYKLSSSSPVVNFSVQMDDKVTKIWNVMARVVGEKEPDRYVILGNHRDAWTFGAADPSSGTTAMLEIARGISELVASGWRPDRTIIFGSWDAEEYGLTGSVEHCELHREILKDRAIVYLNVDVLADSSEGLHVAAAPSINEVVTRLASDIESAQPSMSLYQLWQATDNTSHPIVGNLGSGSDYSGFFQYLGIPSLDLSYSKTGDYPMYHSIYESFDWMDRFGDPGFRRHRAIATLWGALALEFADSSILPLDYSTTATRLKQEAASLASVVVGTGVSLAPLERAVEIFDEAQKCFTSKRASETGGDAVIRALRDRALCDQLSNAERAFCDEEGVPGRSWYRHLIYAPSALNHYAGGAFPAVVDAVLTKQPSEIIETQVYRAARVIMRSAEVLCDQQMIDIP